MFVKQEKQNKLSTPYNPTPHTVENVKGSMVTATKGEMKTTCNSSLFKKMEGDPEDCRSEDKNSPDLDEPKIKVPEEIIKDNVEADQEHRSRSGRIIHKPKYLDEFET